MKHNFQLHEHEGKRKEQAAGAEHHASILRACAQKSVSVRRATGRLRCRHQQGLQQLVLLQLMGTQFFSVVLTYFS